jgi:hypothetical protein
MLHLLSVRVALIAVLFFAAAAALAAVYTGVVGNGDLVKDATTVFRWSSILGMGIIVAAHVAWRWIPAVRTALFPYLGGHWTGVVRFDRDNTADQRAVTLEVKHNLVSLKLLLESDESRSWTMVVHAERSAHFDRYRLFYVYLNERKEGVPGAGERYRGLAILRIEQKPQLALYGDYFTDTHRRGRLELTCSRASPWWKVWR